MTTLIQTTLIQTGKLKALLRFAAVKDMRSYLNGVYFEPEGYAVATDGAAMLCVRVPAFEGPSFIAPSDTIKAALQLNKKMSEIAVSSLLIGGISFTPIDGKYPDWRRVIPAKPDGEPATFDPDLLSRAKAAWRDMGAGDKTAAAVRVNHNGESGALMVYDEAIAVIMPVRTKTKLEGKWVDTSPDPVAAVAAFLGAPHVR